MQHKGDLALRGTDNQFDFSHIELGMLEEHLGCRNVPQAT